MAATIVDVAGGALATLPGAAPIVRCELVPALLRLLAADGTPASVLVIALRTFCGLFACCPGLLKLHLEQFVAVCARVALDAHGAPRPHAPLVLRAPLHKAVHHQHKVDALPPRRQLRQPVEDPPLPDRHVAHTRRARQHLLLHRHKSLFLFLLLLLLVLFLFLFLTVLALVCTTCWLRVCC